MPRFGFGRLGVHLRSTALLALVIASTSGCGSADDWARAGLPEGITEESSHTQNLWVGSWIAAMVVGVVTWGLILGAAIVYRRRKHDRGLPPQVRYNVPIEALYTVLPFIIIAVLFFFTVRDQNTILHLSDGPPQNEINVVGKQWSWDFNYTTGNVYDTGTPSTPPTLVIPRGERVRFVLTSRDVIHAFWVVPFLFKMDVIPGRVNRFEVVPQKTGTFAGKCAEFCGLDHARMLFTVRVVERPEYDAHLRSLAAKGNTGSLPTELGEREIDSRSESSTRTDVKGRQE